MELRGTMMRKGETTKPCHGCGEQKLRDANTVCLNCQHLLQEARHARELQAQGSEQQAYTVPATFPFYGIPASSQSGWTETRRLLDTITEQMSSVIRSTGTPAAGVFIVSTKLFSFPKGRRVEYGHNDSRLMLKPATAQAIDQLDTAIQAALEVAYKIGKQDGSHLLQQLASGEITVTAFNGQTVKSK